MRIAPIKIHCLIDGKRPLSGSFLTLRRLSQGLHIVSY